MQISYFDDSDLNPQQTKDSKDLLRGFRMDFFGEISLFMSHFFDKHLEMAISEYSNVSGGGNYAN